MYFSFLTIYLVAYQTNLLLTTNLLLILITMIPTISILILAQILILYVPMQLKMYAFFFAPKE